MIVSSISLAQTGTSPKPCLAGVCSENLEEQDSAATLSSPVQGSLSLLLHGVLLLCLCYSFLCYSFVFPVCGKRLLCTASCEQQLEVSPVWNLE